MTAAQIIPMNSAPANSIQVIIKTVYGEDKIYPACSKAETFCKMLHQKTLTEVDILSIKALGFQVNVVNNRPASL